MTAPKKEWPREIWMAELDEYHNGQAQAVLSVHATVARYDGDTERARDFHKYVDSDIHESLERYTKSMVVAAYDAGIRDSLDKIASMWASTTQDHMDALTALLKKETGSARNTPQPGK